MAEISFLTIATIVRRCRLAAFGLVSLICGLSATHAEEAGVEIGVGDLVQVAVNAEATVAQTLSGEFRVRADGTIDYPVLGSVAVAGLMPEAVARRLRDLFGERVPIIGVPAVSVSEYAPVFLLGDVGQTGPIEYKPNLTVLEVLLLAGGIKPGAESPALPAQELADLELQVGALRVERDRLLAAVRDEAFDGGAVPEHLRDELAPVLTHEIGIFEARRGASQARSTAYQGRREVLDGRIRSLEQSIGLYDEEVRLSEERVATQRGLVERALVARSTLTELELQLILTKRGGIEVRTDLFEAEQDRAALEQEIAEAGIGAELERLEALRDVEVDLARGTARLEAVRGPEGISQQEGSPQDGLLGYRAEFTLMRRIGGEYQVNIVDEAAELQRGDVLRVDAAPATAADLSTSPPVASPPAPSPQLHSEAQR